MGPDYSVGPHPRRRPVYSRKGRSGPVVEFIQQVVNGLSLGSIYALIAVGLTLIFGIARVGNFAHGDFMMVAAYAFVILLMDAGWGLPLATLAAIVIAASLAFMVERLVFRRLYRAPGTTSFTAALGLSTAIQAGVIVVLSGTPRQVGGSWISNVIQIGSIRISGPRAMAIVGSMIALGALAAFLTIGKFGKAIRAVAQNNDAAQMVGIPISRIRVITMLLAGVLAGWAASLIAPIFGAMPSMGVLLTLKSMAIVIAGGLGSVGGALIGAYVLGISEALVAGYISHDFQHALAFVLLAVFLLLRPGGMFGEGTVAMELRR
jgi:branched-chain amino acid transport system permease protein